MSKSIPFHIFLITLNVSILLGDYEIGDTISIVDQQVSNNICYGEYENDVYMIGHTNYLINGGNKQITIMKLSAAW